MNAWLHLKPQLSEFIRDLHFKGWTDAEIADKLSNRQDWVTLAPFRGEVFNYESADFTLHQLCNTVEMLTGSDQSFVDELRFNISGLLKVEYEHEVVAAEAQRQMQHEFVNVIEKENAA